MRGAGREAWVGEFGPAEPAGASGPDVMRQTTPPSCQLLFGSGTERTCDRVCPGSSTCFIRRDLKCSELSTMVLEDVPGQAMDSSGYESVAHLDDTACSLLDVPCLTAVVSGVSLCPLPAAQYLPFLSNLVSCTAS